MTATTTTIQVSSLTRLLVRLEATHAYLRRGLRSGSVHLVEGFEGHMTGAIFGLVFSRSSVCSFKR
ncbi:MAG: hypothetical protein WBY98_21880 [Candidatus Sulfotelmatobacter sp.]